MAGFNESTPKKLQSRIITDEVNRELTTVYPHFIASKYDLLISAVKVEGRYYLHENGTAVRYMKETGIYRLFEKEVKTLEKVFGVKLVGDRLRCSYKGGNGWFDFIKNLIFILNLDIVLPRLKTEERYFTDVFFVPDIESREDISDLKNRIRLKSFEKDNGFLICFGIKYSYSDTSDSTVFFKEDKDGSVFMDDGETHFKYHRDVLELISQLDDGFTVFQSIIGKICERYRLQLKDGKIFMISKPQTEVLLNNYFCFLQAAVLLSEIGDAGILGV